MTSRDAWARASGSMGEVFRFVPQERPRPGRGLRLVRGPAVLAAGVPLAAATVAACASPQGSAPTPSTSHAAGSTETAAPAAPPAPETAATVSASPVRPSKVLVVMEENRSYANTARNMPYLVGLGSKYGHATAMRGVTHPSLPNYLAIAGGSTFGITDDRSPSSHPLVSSTVFGQARAAGRQARVYAEGMTTACQRFNTGRYAVRHNPWTYFTSSAEHTGCRANDVPAGTTTSGALHNDIVAGRLPTVGMLVPDVCHDGHDCSAATADAWLRRWMPAIMAGPDYRAGRLAVVITFDEDDKRSGNLVYTAVVHPSLHGKTVTKALNHYSLSASLSRISGRTPLRKAATAPPFLTAFGLAG